MTNDAMEATWIGFHLWAAAVEAVGSTDVDRVRAALGGLADHRAERLHGQDG